ncbi:MAG: ASCH domain-containing protein [Flavobacteriales bacterium]|nr:ASCH domain-containing protein [Flavobacteriales bacterium]
MNIILSIKPKYANAILSGEKLVEFRKLAFKRKVERVYIYSSSPEQRIIGYFTIEDIISDTPKELWRKYKRVGSICQEDFFKYFGEKEIGFSIKIKSVRRFEISIDPKVLFKNFVPPQSFMYCDEI